MQSNTWCVTFVDRPEVVFECKETSEMCRKRNLKQNLTQKKEEKVS